LYVSIEKKYTFFENSCNSRIDEDTIITLLIQEFNQRIKKPKIVRSVRLRK